MNTASPELCKELYELSGWEPDEYLDRETGYVYEDDDGWTWPAYSLGHLMRKLPPTANQERYLQLIHADENSVYEKDTWYCGYTGYSGNLDTLADTPEDAVCQLAIKLFRQGVLRESQ